MCVVGKNLNSPNWSSIADDSITRGSIGVPDLKEFSLSSPCARGLWLVSHSLTFGQGYYNTMNPLANGTISILYFQFHWKHELCNLPELDPDEAPSVGGVPA